MMSWAYLFGERNGIHECKRCKAQAQASSRGLIRMPSLRCAWSEGLDTCARPPKIRHRCHYAPFRTKSSWANDDVNLKWSTPLTQRTNVLKTTTNSCLGSTVRFPSDATPCSRARHVRGRHSREERTLGEAKQKRSLSLE